MRTTLFFIVALTLATAVTSTSAELPNFFMAPVSTPLHRHLVGDNASMFLVVNGDAWKSKELTLIDEYDTFVGALKEASESHPGHVSVLVHHPKAATKPRESKTGLLSSLEQVCHSAGFQSATVREVRTSSTWEEEAKLPLEYEEANGATEQMEGNEYVQAFPVRTKLSKFFHPKADCVVGILPAFDGREESISSDLDKAIRQAVKRLRFEEEEKDWLWFEMKATDAGLDLIGKLFRNTKPIRIPPDASPALRRVLLEERKKQRLSPGQLLANELGFSRVGYGVRILGGSPETLIGKVAPDFSLPLLDGQKLQLKRFLSGRPGIVSFWGMACLPCRAEAPILTQMHSSYGERIGIVAVNGYAEAREDVADYAKKRNLTHPIVVNGSKTADEKYFVGAYPSTFFIDKKGIIVSYVIGLESYDDLNARVDELLEP